MSLGRILSVEIAPPPAVPAAATDYARYDMATMNNVLITAEVVRLRDGRVTAGHNRAYDDGQHYRIVATSGGTFRVHRVVCGTFDHAGFLDETRPIVHHRHGVRSDNRESNLEWTTSRNNLLFANMPHARRIATSPSPFG